MKKIRFGKTRTVYQGTIFAIEETDVLLPDGKKTVFEFCKRPPSVSVLAFNEKQEILLIQEYRYGYKHDTWFLPGGRMDHPGDTPKKAAQRELREETGYRAKTMKLIHKKAPGNTLIWDIYIYAAKDLVHDPLPQDPGEKITPVFVPFKTAVRMALDGTIDNEFIAYNLIRFDYLLRHKLFTW